MVVFPSGNVFDALLVIVTCWISVAVALPIGIVLLSSEVASKVIPGGTVSCGGVVFLTSTTWVAFDLLPDSSFATHSMVVFPSGNVFDALLVIVTCWMSVAVALPNGTVLSLSEVASKVTLAGTISFGAVVSFTVTV